MSNKKAIKFICIFLCAFIAAAGTLSAAAYCLDPQNVYRQNKNGVRYYNQLYSLAPSVRTYDYDYVFIGSSMMQNFDADYFANELGCKPLKLTLGALTAPELMWLYDCVQEQSKAKTYVINIDLHRFAACEDVSADSGRMHEYMYNPTGLSQFKYLLGYETWLRFIPLQIGLTAIQKLKITLPESMNSATDINTMTSWDDSTPPGKEKLYRDFADNNTGFNEGDTSVFSRNATENMKVYLAKLAEKLDSSEEMIIYLPPYSALYWADKSEGQRSTLYELRCIIAAFASEHDNIHLLDLQAEDYVTDLDCYIDASHYAEKIRKVAQQNIINCKGEPDEEEIIRRNNKIESFAKSITDNTVIK